MPVKDIKILTSILNFRFNVGDFVQKKSGSFWQGKIVGYYSTEQTPEGYNIQLYIPGLDHPNMPTQIYPVEALQYWEP